MKNLLKKILGDKISNAIHTRKVENRKRKEYKYGNRRECVERFFNERMPYKINLDNPQTFNEKISWLKLNWYNPNAKICADKYKVREYIKNLGYEDLLVDLYGVWDKPRKINVSKLPNSFILKTNNGCGDHYICKDKSNFNKKEAVKILNKNFKRDYAPMSLEWTYEGMKPMIICEQLLDENGHTPLDYKIICNNGKAKHLYVCKRHNCVDGAKLELTYYDTNFNAFNCKQIYPNISSNIEKPKNFDRMIELAEILSKEFPLVRVDFYNINGKIYFGEYTFFPSGGALPFEPEEYDKILGDMLELPEKQETPFNNEKFKNSN